MMDAECFPSSGCTMMQFDWPSVSILMFLLTILKNFDEFSFKGLLRKPDAKKAVEIATKRTTGMKKKRILYPTESS
jgi:hypothetical protein